jgi:hypothetical protein
MPSGSDFNLTNPGTGNKDAYLAYKYAIEDQVSKRTAESAQDQARLASSALNLSAILALADTEPERNPRNEGGEVLANLYRRLGRLENRTRYLEQNS